MTIFAGPLWGQSEILLNSSYIEGDEPLVLYGGYIFFDNGSKQAIDKLIHLKQNHSQLIFNLSRFEIYFLTLANRIPEKSYSFKRWINPLSGILSAMNNYDISAEELFDDAENINMILNIKIEEKKHNAFYQQLENVEIPLVVTQAIENSIISREAFNNLSFYNSDGECVSKLPLPKSIDTEYIANCLGVIEDYNLK